MKRFVALLFGSAVLLGCDSPTDPPITLSVWQLETTVAVSSRAVSRAKAPEKLTAYIKVRNNRPFPVRIEPESSRVAAGDAFNGFGVRFSFLTTRVDSNGGLGSRAGMYWEEIVLRPGDWLQIDHDIGSLDGAPATWDGHYVIYSTLQGRPLPLMSFRVSP
jgi:hypothetical protein